MVHQSELRVYIKPGGYIFESEFRFGLCKRNIQREGEHSFSQQVRGVCSRVRLGRGLQSASTWRVVNIVTFISGNDHERSFHLHIGYFRIRVGQIQYADEFRITLTNEDRNLADNY